ncbi:hypothetical protein [Enterocloster clostridioformis]|uniref:hypothetical protein n=1 Tax=Enterocloster clostridioformis TaxID=1531 RepID=UPI0034A519CA
MARQAPFTEHEAVLLLDAFLCFESGKSSRKDAVRKCSEELRQMARANGTTIDDTYRNINGITFQMASMESAYRGKTIMKPATKLFSQTVDKYRNDRREYEKILREAKSMLESRKNNEAEFMAWLSKKVSAAQLSELYMTFQEIEQQAKKSRIVEKSLYENIDAAVFKRIRSDIERSRVFKFTHKRQMGRINSSLNFLIQYAQEAESQQEEAKEPIATELPKTEDNSAPDVKQITQPTSNAGEKNVNFQAIPNMAFTKPVDFSYFGELKEERSWRTLYADLCGKLLEDYPDVFDKMLKESMTGITKVWLVDDKHTGMLAAPKRVAGNYFIETNRSALDIIKSIRWILDQCSVDYENVIIRYTQQGEGERATAVVSSSPERKYKRDDKEGFYQWMLHDQHMAEASCRGYVSSIRGAEKYAVAHKLAETRLFGVSAEEAKATADALFTDEEFIAKNEEQHNRFRAAITKLLTYLGVDWVVPGRTGGTKRNLVQSKKQKPDVDTSPYEAVLAQSFPRGFRLNSSIEMKKFRRYFEQVNGTELAEEADYIEGVIRSCGIEHEGRIYAPSTMLSDELRDKLFSYIDRTFDSGKSVIYFEALFREFSEEFLDHNIYDADMLKTYITHMAGDRFFIARSYMSIEQRTSADPIEDVRTCLKEQGVPIAVDELCKTLSHIPSDRIRTLLGTNGEFVRNSKGEYFHVDSFSVTDEELENISGLIETEIEDHVFVSGNELYDAIKRKYPYIYERNAIFSVIGWRDALKYRLGDKFSFVGNIISSKDRELSMSDVFENYGKTHGSFTFQELLTFAENIGSTIYFDALYQSAARVSMDKFVSRDRVSFQVKETDRILDRFCTSDYLALPQITDFGIFPEASYPWTPFLLEHYLAFHSERYYLMHGGYNRKVVVGAMVRKRKQYESFDDLVTDILAESDAPLQKKAALNYLSDNGYIARRSYTGIEALLINARAKRNMKEK